jgi:hypothetical protein
LAACLKKPQKIHFIEHNTSSFNHEASEGSHLLFPENIFFIISHGIEKKEKKVKAPTSINMLEISLQVIELLSY